MVAIAASNAAVVAAPASSPVGTMNAVLVPPPAAIWSRFFVSVPTPMT
jgi:hypothetical protein